MSDPRAVSSEWLIKRNCSAGPGELAIVFGSLVAVSFIFGLGFAALGLWMVLPFVGLELIAVAAAFFCYGRHAADFERISIGPGVVSVERVEGARTHRWELDPRISHVEVEQSPGRWGKRVRLFLLAPAVRLELGQYLLDQRRLILGREINSALMVARGGAL